MIHKNKISLCEFSKDNLSAYEICAGKRKLESLKKLIELYDSRDNDEMFEWEKEKIFHNFDVLKSALNIALDNKNVDLCDIQVFDC